MDAEAKGYIGDKDHIYGLFLSMGVTFQSEEEFISALSIALAPQVEVDEKQDLEEEDRKEEKEESEESEQLEEYKLTKDLFIQIMRDQVDKIDPVDGIIADIEAKYEVTDDYKVSISDLVRYFEGENWLEASKDAIMAIVVKHEDAEGKVDYRTALFEIVQD